MTGRTRLIGIDPGLRRTGWGIVECEGTRLVYVADGTLVSDAALDLARRLVQLHDGLVAVIAEWRPHEAAVEQTFVNKDAAATLKLGQARGIAMLVPALQGLAVAEYAPNLIKKSVVGVGHAGKDQIHAMVTTLLPRCVPHSADSADALAVAITHAHHRGRATLERMLKVAP
jgi:crossover junction endodeoxyribonuclease RuvC